MYSCLSLGRNLCAIECVKAQHIDLESMKKTKSTILSEKKEDIQSYKIG